MPTLAEIDAQIAELEKQKAVLVEAEEAKKRVEKGKHIVAKVSALKTLFLDLKDADEDALPGAWSDTSQQALPREKLIGRRYGLSETETENAKAAGVKAARGI